MYRVVTRTGILLLLLLCVALIPAAAESYLSGIAIHELSCAYKDIGQKEAAKLPVYSAPFDNAWRGANGKAAVYTGETFKVLGSAQNGEWLWVDYEVSKGEHRIGWIHMSYQTAPKEVENWFPLDGKLFRLTRNTVLTDDPCGSNRVMRELQAGETVIGLCSFDDHSALEPYFYVETEIDGQPAWGFINRYAVEDVPMMHIEGDTLVIHEGVTAIGNFWSEETYDEEGDVLNTSYPTFEPGRQCINTLIFGEDIPRTVRHVQFPSTLTAIGGESISFANLDELVFPPSFQMGKDYCIYASNIGRIVIPAGYTGDMKWFERCTVGAYEVEAGNPRYKTVDGVLFSADGKTLISYPNGKKDLHYDVPAGVETIAQSAFNVNLMEIPLQSISLPIGLKCIEAYAFSGCGRLNSITVPLTVRELDPNAFAYCASLERISLPPGLTAEKRNGAVYTNDAVFNGDNGESVLSSYYDDEDGYRDEKRDQIANFRMMLISRDGSGEVKAYGDVIGNEVVSVEKEGTICFVQKIEEHRASVMIRSDFDRETYRWNHEYVWYDLDNLVSPPDTTLFEITNVDFAPGSYRNEDGDEIYAEKAEGFTVYDSSVELDVPVFVTEDGDDYLDTMRLILPIREVALYRTHTGDTRTLGLLLSETDALILTLRDAVNGADAVTVGTLEQAEMLVAESGWLQVRTAHGTGWVKQEQFMEVKQED